MSDNKPANEFIAIGKIVGVHGLGGNLKVISHSGLTASYDSGQRLFVKAAEKTEGEYYIVDWSKSHKKGILLKFKNLDRNIAEKLIGCELFVGRNDLPELDEDTYFWFDLIGLSVFTIDETYLGTIQSIIPTGSNDVYIVKNDDRETLIPAIHSVIKHIDLETGKMYVDLPEGL